MLDDLADRRRAAEAMGGPDRVARHRSTGKLDARTRVTALCDPGSIVEIGRLVGDVPADAFVAALGTIDGRPVAVGAEDFTVAGGSIGRGGSAKRYRLAELAGQERMPLVMLLEGAGHRPPMPGDPTAMRTPGDLGAMADLAGVVPLATAVLGPSAGHGALAAPLADFTVMTSDAAIFAAGPPLVKASIGEDVTKEQLGGPDVALASGLIDNLAADDDDALDQIRRWLSYLPSSCHGRPRTLETTDGDRPVPELTDLVPRNPRQAYDMAAVIDVIVDHDSFFAIGDRFGPSMLGGFARMGGRAVAVLANQPRHLAGAIDADAADKATALLGVADAFGLPLILLTDNPGVLAGTAAEKSAILRHAGAMYAAQRRFRHPKFQVTLRKAYGFGSTAMGMNPFDGQTLNLAFPGVTFGAMPARGADDATGADDAGRVALREAELASGYRSAAGLSVDDLIDPSETRSLLLRGLAATANALRGHRHGSGRGGGPQRWAAAVRAGSTASGSQDRITASVASMIDATLASCSDVPASTAKSAASATNRCWMWARAGRSASSPVHCATTASAMRSSWGRPPRRRSSARTSEATARLCSRSSSTGSASASAARSARACWCSMGQVGISGGTLLRSPKKVTCPSRAAMSDVSREKPASTSA